MKATLDDLSIESSARDALWDMFERSSAYVANVAEPDPLRRSPTGFRQELESRWNSQLALDTLVAAIGQRDADKAIMLAEQSQLRMYLNESRSALAGVFAMMIYCGNNSMLDYVRAQLGANQSLALERFNGRTLLHIAAAAGNPQMVELLLHLGIAPDSKDGGRHTPLYSVANECVSQGAVDVVHTLIRAGANVDACEGVKRCTPLHMAARRNNTEVAEALMDHGAAIEARDSAGDTPLRRAVNCSNPLMVSLLLAKGANVHSIGSKGLTPLQAARTVEMRRLLSP